MKYTDVLKRYIQESNKPLAQIADELVAYGFNIDKAYLSRLQNGRKPPASDELNRALANVTGHDPIELVTAAFLEKAPLELQGDAQKLAILKSLKLEHENALHDHLQAVKEVEKSQQAVLDARGTLASLLAESRGEVIEFTAPDDSLIGSRIFEGDLLAVQLQESVLDGEIAAVEIEGQLIFRRITSVDGQFILTADNPKYNPMILPTDQVLIIGRVVQVTFNPNK